MPAWTDEHKLSPLVLAKKGLHDLEAGFQHRARKGLFGNSRVELLGIL